MIRTVRCYSLFLLAVVLLGATPLWAQATTSLANCSLTAEDYAVFSAVLLNRGGPEDPEERWDDKPELLISDATTGAKAEHNNMWGFRSTSQQAPSDETVAGFNAHQINLCPLKAELNPAIQYSLISQTELDGYFKKKHDGWEKFYKKHPKAAGFVNFSPVGYNASGTEAVVFLGHHCGWLCGTGHLFLLAKENGQWVVRNRLMLWIS